MNKFILLLTLLFITKSQTNPTISILINENIIVNNWSTLSKQLNEVVDLNLWDVNLSEKSFVKLLSHDFPKLKNLRFSNKK